MKTTNQLHPPRPKKRGVVELNKKCTMIKKDGVTSTVVGVGTKPALDIFLDSLRENAKRLDISLVGRYIIVNHEIKSGS